MTLDDFMSFWRARREEYAKLRAQIDAATLIDQFLTELEAVRIDQSMTLLTLTQAAATCGYSTDHLGRLVRSGQLINHGRRHAPRVRLGDLPRRPKPRSASGGLERNTYDPVADAWALKRRQQNRQGEAIG